MIQRGSPSRSRAGVERDFPRNVATDRLGLRLGVQRSVPEHVQEILATADVAEVRTVLELGSLATLSSVPLASIETTDGVDGEILTLSSGVASWEP